jgi:hypothetical protein
MDDFLKSMLIASNRFPEETAVKFDAVDLKIK